MHKYLTIIGLALLIFGMVPNSGAAMVKSISADDINTDYSYSSGTGIFTIDNGVDNIQNLYPAGYLSLRVTGKTSARLGMQQFSRTGHVEMTMIARPDGNEIINRLESLALRHGAILHWGQSNGMMTAADVERSFGRVNIDRWRSVQRAIGGDTFINLLT